MSTFFKLQNPVQLDSNYRNVGFDSAHQHTLLYQDVSFYSWKHEVEGFQPRLIATVGELKQYKHIAFARQSLDCQLIAIQISLIKVIVVDCISKRSWPVTIKTSSSDENSILKEGLIWSEHGGNSQDLILVTRRGLELYKVSPIRNQCKLSREIKQADVQYFWYEPNHRMILLSSPQRIGKTSKEVFKMTGYFLRSEISDMPKLELPPPEKTETFDLGPGIMDIDISLVTLYGNLFCTVHYSIDDKDHITMYGITKQSVSRLYSLALYQPRGIVRVSVVDNLLCCHAYSTNSVVVFDLKRPITQSANVINAMFMEPICASSNLVIEDPDHASSATGGTQPARRNSQKAVVSAAPIPAPPTDDTDWDAVGDSSMVLHAGMGTSLEQNQGESGDGGKTSYIIDSLQSASEMLGQVTLAVSDSIAESTHQLMHSSDTALTQSDSRIPIVVIPSEVAPADEELRSTLTRPSQTADAQPANSGFQYNDNQWQFLSPHWVWNKSNRRMWKIGCLLPDVSDSIVDTRRAILFLAQRGQIFRAPRPVYKNEPHIDLVAKRLMLERISAALHENLSMSWLEVLFKLIIAPYANEVNRISNSMVMPMYTNELDSISSKPQPDPSTTTQALNNPRTRTSGGSAFTFASAYVSSFGSSSSAAAGQANNQQFVGRATAPNAAAAGVETEPIEPAHAMYLFLPNITAVSGRSKVRANSPPPPPLATNSQNPSLIHPDAVDSISDQIVQLPLSGRRDSQGSLIVSQTEMLSYIWLPLIFHRTVSLDYCRWSLCTYITTLRSSQPHVYVHPAISILLLNLLVAEGRYIEMAHLLQLQFFPDSVELAMTALELSDVIMNAESMNLALSPTSALAPPKLFPGEKIRQASAVQILQQVGVDMLWRMHERATVIRWLLGRGLVLEAISLCMKIRGAWRQGLSPGSISGIDFYLAGLQAVEFIKHARSPASHANLHLNMQYIEPLPVESVEIASTSNDANIDEFAAVDEDEPIVSRRHDSSATDAADQEALAAAMFAAKLRELESEEDMVCSQRVELLHTVYKFILDWDRSVLSVNESNRQKSKLSSHAQFPDHLFSVQQAALFKDVFGYR